MAAGLHGLPDVLMRVLRSLPRCGHRPYRHRGRGSRGSRADGCAGSAGARGAAAAYHSALPPSALWYAASWCSTAGCRGVRLCLSSSARRRVYAVAVPSPGVSGGATTPYSGSFSDSSDGSAESIRQAAASTVRSANTAVCVTGRALSS